MTPDQVLDRYWKLDVLPVDPEAIARDAGIEVTDIDASEASCGAIGVYVPSDGNNPPRIQVDRAQRLNRVRFTLAHELGHHFLGHNERLLRDTSRNFNINNFQPREVAANNFAAQLLMPTNYVKFLIETEKMSDFSKLAEAFAVSELAMEIRLKKLKYIR